MSKLLQTGFHGVGAGAGAPRCDATRVALAQGSGAEAPHAPLRLLLAVLAGQQGRRCHRRSVPGLRGHDDTTRLRPHRLTSRARSGPGAVHRVPPRVGWGAMARPTPRPRAWRGPPGDLVPRRARYAWRNRRARLRGRRGPGDCRAAQGRPSADCRGPRRAQRGVDRRLGRWGAGRSVEPQPAVCPRAGGRGAPVRARARPHRPPGLWRRRRQGRWRLTQGGRHTGEPRPPGRGKLRKRRCARAGTLGDQSRHAGGGAPAPWAGSRLARRGSPHGDGRGAVSSPPDCQRGAHR